MNANPPGPKQAAKSPSNVVRLGEIVLWLAIIGTVASIAIPAFSPASPPRAVDPNASGAALGLALWLYLLAKLKKWPHAWAFPLLGIAIWMVVGVAGVVVRGRTPADELIASVERFDPQAGNQLRAAKNDPTVYDKVLNPALIRALQQASDAAVLDYYSARLQLISPESGTNLPRCLAVSRGLPPPGPISAGEEAAHKRALVRVFDAAALQYNPQAALDEEKAQTMLDAVANNIDPGGVLSDASKFASLSDAEQCQMYLDLTRGIRALPSADAALVVRFILSVSARG